MVEASSILVTPTFTHLKRGIIMGNVTSIPEGKGTPEEKAEFESFRNGEENLYEAGINVGKKGFYDPSRGEKKEKNKRPEPTYGPILATDPGQPESVARVTGRQEAIDRSESLDKSEPGVVRSKPNARKASAPKPSNQG